MAINDEERAFLDKLEQVVEDALKQQGIVHFTPEEAELLKRVAARERAWASIGALAGSVKTVLTWFGFMIATWMAFKTGLIAWLSEALGGAK